MIRAQQCAFAIVLFVLLAGVASADVIATFGPTSLSNADPTQMGRLSRNGIPQDWAGDESFPGTLNPAIAYHYETFSVNVGSLPFVQIEMDDISTFEFISAYNASFNPLSLSTNWLGDAGTSGNFFGVDPVFFQVIVPVNGTLVLVVNNTTGGALTGGTTGTFSIRVEGFLDQNFDTPVATPEPSSVILRRARC
jgi:hypothetical protein